MIQAAAFQIGLLAVALLLGFGPAMQDAVFGCLLSRLCLNPSLSRPAQIDDFSHGRNLPRHRVRRHNAGPIELSLRRSVVRLKQTYKGPHR